jgi:hypothetical protein
MPKVWPNHYLWTTHFKFFWGFAPDPCWGGAHPPLPRHHPALPLFAPPLFATLRRLWKRVNMLAYLFCRCLEEMSSIESEKWIQTVDQNMPFCLQFLNIVKQTQTAGKQSQIKKLVPCACQLMGLQTRVHTTQANTGWVWTLLYIAACLSAWCTPDWFQR